METLVEQRREARTQLSWPVSLWVPEAHRFFNGRSSNVSKTGAYVTVPITTPIRTGNTVELNFPRTTSLASEKGQFARLKNGSVVRVERKQMLKDGSIGVAIAFEQL
ncbi:MAG: PilZ domain-containing protein [Sedimentisphaerales bacterium]|nr:PilZ domain-containing protein [Sedimentisphaerales bacterium]